MLDKLAGIIPALAKTVTGAVQQRADQRHALAKAGYEARLGSWTDDYLVYLITSPMAFLVLGAVIRLFDDELGQRVQLSGEQLVSSLGALFSEAGWYGYFFMTTLTVGLGLSIGNKVTDRAIKKKVDQI